MECPYCGCELEYNSYMYKGNLAAYERGNGGGFEKTGDLWICKNREGFDDYEEREEYVLNNDLDNCDDEICCESNIFSGHFWTDLNGNLNEGYPC